VGSSAFVAGIRGSTASRRLPPGSRPRVTESLGPCHAGRVSAPIPLVRAAALQVAAGFLERTGAPVERLLARAKLSPRVLEHAEALVPVAAVSRFLEDAARSEGREDLGLSIGRHVQVQQVGTFGRLIGQSLTWAKPSRQPIACCPPSIRGYAPGSPGDRTRCSCITSSSTAARTARSSPLPRSCCIYTSSAP
jgi:hypothetical protein